MPALLACPSEMTGRTVLIRHDGSTYRSRLRRVKRGVVAAFLALTACAGALCAAALAGPLTGLVGTGTTATTPSGTDQTTTTFPEPTRIANGVTVAGVPVGGMTAAEAAVAVTASFARPLVLVAAGHWLSSSPRRLGASADVKQAV